VLAFHSLLRPFHCLFLGELGVLAVGFLWLSFQVVIHLIRANRDPLGVASLAGRVISRRLPTKRFTVSRNSFARVPTFQKRAY
jgi:hypothetical protein